METIELKGDQQVMDHTSVYCSKSADCKGGSIFKTKLSCGCCFCEKGCEICEWHTMINSELQ